MGSVAARARVVVHGVVQGVGFRWACQEAATSRDVRGWVRNRPDGTVEAVFEGEPSGVDAMVAWAGHGPRHARVTRVDVTREEPEGLTGFRAG